MSEIRAQRRLAAILAADVVGYSRLLDLDEQGTLAALRAAEGDPQPLVRDRQGRVVKVMGDGVLIEFGSAVNAVSCAVELQKRMAAANEGLAVDRQINLHIGINLGDVVVEDGDLFGDGVVVAVRLQAMAGAGDICVSGSVYDQVKRKLDCGSTNLVRKRSKTLLNRCLFIAYARRPHWRMAGRGRRKRCPFPPSPPSPSSRSPT